MVSTSRPLTGACDLDCAFVHRRSTGGARGGRSLRSLDSRSEAESATWFPQKLWEPSFRCGTALDVTRPGAAFAAPCSNERGCGLRRSLFRSEPGKGHPAKERAHGESGASRAGIPRARASGMLEEHLRRRAWCRPDADRSVDAIAAPSRRALVPTASFRVLPDPIGSGPPCDEPGQPTLRHQFGSVDELRPMVSRLPGFL